MATPMLEVLRERPEAGMITVICREYVSQILERSSHIDRLLVYERRGGVRSASSLLSRERPAGGWEAVFVLPPSFSSALLALVSKGRRRIGFGGWPRSMLLTDAVRPERDRMEHLSDSFVSLVDKVMPGREAGTPLPEVIPPDDWRERLVSLRMPGRYLVLAAGAAYGPAKVWPGRCFAEAARIICEGTEIVPVLTGSDGERETMERILEDTGMRGRNLAGSLEISDLISVLRGASAVLGNDSGPVHISAAMGRPTVAVFGSTSPDWTAPRGARSAFVSAGMECSPCFRRECPEGKPACLTGVKPDEAARVLKGLIREDSQ